MVISRKREAPTSELDQDLAFGRKVPIASGQPHPAVLGQVAQPEVELVTLRDASCGGFQQGFT
jgi:hypothetical protein